MKQPITSIRTIIATRSDNGVGSICCMSDSNPVVAPENDRICENVSEAAMMK